MIIIYVTHPNIEHAKTIAKAMLDERLAACVNITPVDTLSLWKGTCEENKEVVTILKSHESLWEKIQERIAELHEYDVPCIIKIPVSANEAFESWIADETQL